MSTTRKLLWNLAGLLVVLSLVLSATFVFSAYPVSAQKEPPQDPQTEELPPDDPTEAEVGQAEPEVGALMNSALKDGSVGVIVVLNVPEAPEPDKPGQPATAYAAAQDALVSSMVGFKVENVHQYQNFPLVAMRVDAAALRALLRNKLVAAVEEDAKNFPILQDSSVIVGSTEAAEAGYTGAGVTVAVIDTGVDKNHAFLAGHVVAEACFSGGGGYGTSLCPNGLSEQIGTGAGVPCNVVDGCKHGTHVAGIIAGNGAGFYGVARGANIIAINVFSWDAQDGLVTYSSDYLKGLDHVYSLRNTYTISSINMSLGGGGYTKYCDSVLPAVKQAIARLRNANIATVIASGNNGYINAISRPACISNAISVGSTDKNDSVSYFSNSASFLALLAPGEGIYSSIPGGYETLDGTSMATPHVAGAWAVLRQAFPTKSVSSLLSLLKSTGVKVKDYRNGKVKPRINVAYALAKYQKPTVSPALLAPADGETLTDSTPELTWDKLPLVTKYKVVIKLGSRTAFSKIYTADSVCGLTGDTCTLHVPTILKTGLHTWTVQPYSGAGGGPVSLARSFSTPSTVPGSASLTYPVGAIGYYSPSFQWDELANPTAAKYTLKIYKDGKRLLSKTYEALKICTGGSCYVSKPLKLKEGNYTWEVLPWNPVGYGPTASGTFDMYYANGYDNHFDDNLAGFTTLYPQPGWWWLSGSDLVTWYGNDYTWASARIDATYSNFDVTTVMYRNGDSIYSNGIILRGTPTITGREKDWKSGYEFLYVNDGYYSVWKRYGSRTYNIQPWTYSSAIVNGTNTIRVVASGANMSLYFNGTPVWTGSDNAYGPDLLTGSVGILSFVGDWSDYYDYLYVDRITTTFLVGAAVIDDEDTVSEEQRALNDAAMANPIGSPFGPNVGMEEFEHLQAMPGVPGMSIDEKMQLCLDAGPEKCKTVPQP